MVLEVVAGNGLNPVMPLYLGNSFRISIVATLHTDRAQRLPVPRSEESNHSYSRASYHDRSNEDIEGDENAVVTHNNNILSYVHDENKNAPSIDNEDNNNNDEINGIVALVIQNSPPHPPIERGLSSKSVLIFNDSIDGNAGNSRRSVYAKSMDIDPPSIIRATYRNVMGERCKSIIGVRIMVAARGASSLVIGGGDMDDNVVVETNANQNTSIKVKRTGSGATIIGDGTNTAVDANVVHHIHQTSGISSSERGEILVDVNFLAQPPRPQCPLVPTIVISHEVELVRRGMEESRISIRTRAAIIGGRLKQPMLEIEPFLYTEMPGNPLTILAMLVNRGSQVDSNASDRNNKCYKRLHARNVDGQFRFEI